MSEATRDQNHVEVLLGQSTVDGATVPVAVNPVTGAILLQVTDESLTPVVGDKIVRDQNHVPVTYVKGGDGADYPIHVSPLGGLLIKSI